MIVCVCKNLSEKDIKDMVKKTQDINEIKKMAGIEKSCQACVEYMVSIIKKDIEEIKK